MRARDHGRIAGHHATDGYEPRQVREEAAVSIAVCVMVDSSLTDRGNDLIVVTGSRAGARPRIFSLQHSTIKSDLTRLREIKFIAF